MKQNRKIQILWEYIVKEEYLEQFVQVYSADGAWANLFRGYPGYIGTDLIRDTSHKHRFITIDHWISLAAYSDMKNLSRKEYRSIDEQCEIFSIEENYIGVFEVKE